MTKLFLISVLCCLGLCSGQRARSPCPTVFGFGVDVLTNKPFTYITYEVPKQEVYEFNISASFIPLGPFKSLPQLTLENKETPLKVIQDVISGINVQINVKYDTSAYKLHTIHFNGKEICRDSSVRPEDERLSAHVVEDFHAPIDEISRFKDQFPIEYNSPDCGNAKVSFSPQLYSLLSIGGERAKQEHWPWVVSIYRREELICTGNMISKSVVLTAAHCFPDDTLSHKAISIGLFNGERASIWGYLKHKAHDEYKDDIALVYMAQDLNDPNFAPVCISERLPSEQRGAIVSYGLDGAGRTGILSYLPLNSVTNDVCKRSNDKLERLVTPNHFCGGNNDGTGPCNGDSGSGFLFRENGKWNLRGLLSASLKDGENCDVNNYAIFIDVLQYIQWIPKGSPSFTNPLAKYGQPLLQQSSCGGLGSSPDSFLQDKRWLVQVAHTQKGYSWFGVLISPKHVLTDVLPKYSGNPENLEVSRSFCENCLLSGVSKATRVGSKWYHPTVLELSTPVTGVTPICIDTVPGSRSEEVLVVDGDTTRSTPRSDSSATLSRSEGCLKRLNENARFVKKGQFNPAGISQDLIFCGNVDGELVLQKHSSSRGDYWSFFGYWLLEDVFSGISEYASDIARFARD